MQQSKIEHLDKMLLINLNFSLFSGRRKLKSDDIEEEARAALPPKAIATLGSKRVFDPKRINAFGRLKRATIEDVASVGIRTQFGAMAVARDIVEQGLAHKLDERVAEFGQLKAALLVDYDTVLSNWAAKFPEWKTKILESGFTRAYVDNRLSFSWCPIKIVTDEADIGAAAAGKIGQAVSGMSGQLYREIADKAEELVQKSLIGREKATRKVLRPFRAMAAKLRALQMLDARAKPLADLIEAVVGKMPGDGPLEQAEIGTLFGMASILADPQKALEYGAKVLQASPDDIALSLLVPRVRNVQQQQLSVLPSPVEAAMPAPTPVVAVMPTSVPNDAPPVVMPQADVPIIPVLPRRSLASMVI